jgi:hypothetical protein
MRTIILLTISNVFMTFACTATSNFARGALESCSDQLGHRFFQIPAFSSPTIESALMNSPPRN